MPQMRLDDENETLDWGNEEEEYQESPRKHHNAENGSFVGEDVEDTISLGDDEDDQRFFSTSRHEVTSSSASYNADHFTSPSSYQTKSAASGANPTQRSQEHQPRAADTSVQETVRNQEAPNKRSSTRPSPPRSLPRLTHALPPKPVAASATALSQSYIIAATSMTISPPSTDRDSKKINGNHGLSPASAADLPQDWEKRTSRKGETYYYNQVTHECTWVFPGSKPSVDVSSAQEDSNSRRQHRSVSPGGNKQVPYDSNTIHPQTSRSSREFSRNGEPDIESRRRPLTPDENGLTFEDRHYRPGLNSVSVSDAIRDYDHPDISTSAGRYARSPSPRWRRSPSPSGSKGSDLRFRTKELPRDRRSAQEKSTQPRNSSKLDSYVPDYDSRHYAPSPPPRSPADYHSRQRERASEEDRMQVDDYRAGPSLRKEDINRDHRRRSRDRDLPPARSSDIREPSASQNLFSAQRSRSPAPLPPSRGRDHDVWDGRREAREREYQYEGSGPSIHLSSSIPAARTDRGERDVQRSEWERSRQRERSPGPRNDQDYERGREWQIGADEDRFRGRRLERERIREGERSERDRETRREVNAGIDTDRPSLHRPAEPYAPEPRGSQGDTKSKRSAEIHDRKLEEPASAHPKRAPLPPQQTFFRTAQHRDTPPHLNSSPPKRQEDNLRAVAGEARHSSSTIQPSSAKLSSQNGVDLERVPDGHERHSQLSYARDNTSDRRMDITRDDASQPGRRQFGPGRALPEDLQRSSNIPVDSGRKEQSPRPRVSINDSGRGEPERPKDAKAINREEGSNKDVQLQLHLDRTSSRRGRDAPRPPARLTGTNNIPIGSRRSGFQTGTTTQRPEAMSSTAESAPLPGPEPLISPRNLPPGKESYERPHDLILSDEPGRTESSKSRPLHDIQPRRREEPRGQKPLPRPPALTEQYSNGSGHRPSTPPPVSRDLSGSMPSNVPERLSAYPSSDAKSESSFQNAARSRGTYREGDESARRDPHRIHSSYSPKHLPPAEADGAYSHHDPLPPRLRKSLPGGGDPDVDARFGISGDSKISPADRSDFLSRVEPPPLRRGGSLLDRLSIDTKDRGMAAESLSSPSLRDRLVPAKRDRDEMMMNSEGSSGRGGLGEKLQDLDGPESKRAKKRGGKRRSGGRR